MCEEQRTAGIPAPGERRRRDSRRFGPANAMAVMEMIECILRVIHVKARKIPWFPIRSVYMRNCESASAPRDVLDADIPTIVRLRIARGRRVGNGQRGHPEHLPIEGSRLLQWANVRRVQAEDPEAEWAGTRYRPYVFEATGATGRLRVWALVANGARESITRGGRPVRMATSSDMNRPEPSPIPDTGTLFGLRAMLPSHVGNVSSPHPGVARRRPRTRERSIDGGRRSEEHRLLGPEGVPPR